MTPYKLIKLYETLPLRLFNFLQSVRSVFRPSVRAYLSRNRALINYRKRNHCFILLGGLSAKRADLRRLIGEDVITANMFFKTPDFKRIRPKFHVITDADFFKNQTNLSELAAGTDMSTAVVLNLKHTPPSTNDNWYYILPIYRVLDSNIRIDLRRPTSNFSTVALTCLQLAIFLGYRKVYFIGFDLPPGQMPHYYEESEYEIDSANEIRQIKTEFEYCEYYWQYTNCHHEAFKLSKFAAKNSIEVFNTSVDSYVRAFPYKDFETI